MGGVGAASGPFRRQTCPVSFAPCSWLARSTACRLSLGAELTVRRAIMHLYERLHDQGVIHGDVAWRHVRAINPHSKSGTHGSLASPDQYDPTHARMRHPTSPRDKMYITGPETQYCLIDFDRSVQRDAFDEAAWGRMCTREMEDVRKMLDRASL